MARREPDFTQAVDLFEAFNNEEPQFLDEVYVPDLDRQTLISVGPCLEIAYHARDGHSYRHEFRKKSRPELCVTSNGLHLVLIGGNYRFTKRGITDT